MNPLFWSNKRVLLTGHTGFKGSWLSLWLQSLGAKLVGYALPPPVDTSLFNIANVGFGMTSLIGDIRDLNQIKKVFTQHKPEIVIHMAAQPLVRYSYINPVETYSTNVMGTVNLLEAVRTSSSVKAIAIVTTDKCYENRDWIWSYRENEPMGGFDPYSNSKGCTELVCSAYRSSFFNPDFYSDHGVALATVRAGNVIGGGDWSQDRLIPDIISAFEQNKILKIRNPQAVRPWQYVMEPLYGYLALTEKLYEKGPSYGEGWNFGPSDEDSKPVGWIVDNMASLWGPSAKWEIDNSTHPHEANFLKLDISKARSRLNWSPQMRISEALSLIIDWTKKFHGGANMHNLTLSQINQYQSLIQKSK